MPQLVTYLGRPVKRRISEIRNRQLGLVLVFYAPTPGQKGGSLFVTDEEWKKNGKIEQCAQKPDVRALAAARQH